MHWLKQLTVSRMRNYQLLTSLVAPFIPLWLRWRKFKGKEDPKRFAERFGIPSKQRPKGTLLWLHGASVGEANSVLPLIQKLREHFPEITILLTTGTVTSAQLMEKRLPKGVIHQYVPVDIPKAVDRFIWHWRPDLAFWVESEFWPNLIASAHDYGALMGVINARMSERSFNSWQKRPAMIRQMLSCFDLVYAQSEQDATRLKTLGAKNVTCVGNLKYDAALLSYDENELQNLKRMIGTRPVWLAASTHPGEEIMIAQAHKLLSATRPNLLTIIVPRHPDRGLEIAQELKKTVHTALRSHKEPISTDTKIYIADTLGELGLFFRLCEIVFMGGSLVNHGGQNPLEPARLSCAIVTGPYTHNFADIYHDMETANACVRAANPQKLTTHIDRLFNDSNARSTLQNTVRLWIQNKGGAIDRLLDDLDPLLSFNDNAKKGAEK